MPPTKFDQDLPPVKASEITIDASGRVIVNNPHFTDVLKRRLAAKAVPKDAILDNCDCARNQTCKPGK